MIENLIKKIDNKFPYEYLDGHLLIQGDCMEIMELMDDGSVDMVLTDPPYFNIVKNKWDRQWESIEDYQKWTGEVGNKFYKILKDNGSFYWFGDDKNVAYCQVELDKQWRLLNNIVWHKTNDMRAKGYSGFRQYMGMTERILFYDKIGDIKQGESEVFNNLRKDLNDERLKANLKLQDVNRLLGVATTGGGMASHYFSDGNKIWELPTEEVYKKLQTTGFFQKSYEELRKEYEELRRPWNNDKNAFDVLRFGICQDEGRFHDTQKPLDLIQYLLQRSSNDNDLILDAFAGSFTTTIACIRTNRKSICIELDKDYYKAGIHRVKEELKQGRFDFSPS